MSTFKAELWDKQSGLILANGTHVTVQETFQKFPFTEHEDIILEYLETGYVGSIVTVPQIQSGYNISIGATPEETLEAYIAIRQDQIDNPPPAPVDTIAAKLDYIMMLLD